MPAGIVIPNPKQYPSPSIGEVVKELVEIGAIEEVKP